MRTWLVFWWLSRLVCDFATFAQKWAVKAQKIQQFKVWMAFPHMQECMMKAAISPKVGVGEMVGFMIRVQSFVRLGDEPRTRTQLFCKIMREFVINDIPDRNEIQAPLFVNIHMHARHSLTQLYKQVRPARV